jgi:hypothetical protein
MIPIVLAADAPRSEMSSASMELISSSRRPTPAGSRRHVTLDPIASPGPASPVSSSKAARTASAEPLSAPRPSRARSQTWAKTRDMEAGAGAGEGGPVTPVRTRTRSTSRGRLPSPLSYETKDVCT